MTGNVVSLLCRRARIRRQGWLWRRDCHQCLSTGTRDAGEAHQVYEAQMTHSARREGKPGSTASHRRTGLWKTRRNWRGDSAPCKHKGMDVHRGARVELHTVHYVGPVTRAP